MARGTKSKNKKQTAGAKKNGGKKRKTDLEERPGQVKKAKASETDEEDTDNTETVPQEPQEEPQESNTASTEQSPETETTNETEPQELCSSEQKTTKTSEEHKKPPVKMNYLHLEELMEDGRYYGDDDQGNGAAVFANHHDSNVGSYPAVASYPAARPLSGKDYWKGNAPVLEKMDYNGESVMLPKLAPRDEPSVTTRKVILDRTISIIAEHQGGNKVNWNWRCQILNTRLLTATPALLTTTKQFLATLKDLNTLNVYTFQDASLHGNTIHQELDINDPGDVNVILAASRADCRYIGLTITFAPRHVVPLGGMIEARLLPDASTLRVYIRAPLNAIGVGGGLLNAIDKNMLINQPGNIFRLAGAQTILAIKHGQIPLKDVFDAWMDERLNEAYFKGMAQVATVIYIGEEVATDTLKQRFHGLGQRRYNPATRKNEYLTVNEFHSEMIGLLQETSGMDAVTIAAQIPELDSLFYHGLVKRMQDRQELARLTQHPPSANLGENMQRLQEMVNRAKAAEHEINQVVTISMGNQYRRQPIGGQGTNPVGRAFLSTSTSQDSASPPRDGNAGRTMLTNTPGSNQTAASSELTTFALTMLSNAERALRESSNTNAPIKCWGCDGLFPNSDHLYRDCPHKEKRNVQEQFKIKLDEFLARRRQKSAFDPQRYKRDGFFSKKAVTMFNDICNEELDGSTRQALISSFVSEWSNQESKLSTPMQLRSRDKDNDGNGVISLPFWLLDEFARAEGNPKSFQFTPQASSFPIRYPITSELPHVDIPVGKNFDATVEGLLDSGGACTMGDLVYWSEVVKRFPRIVAHFDELEQHQEKPIMIGGVGAGKVAITHVLGLWLPWKVGPDETKLVIGLGDNMPVNLLIGLPFQIATRCVVDIGNLKCFSELFNTTWKLTLKSPRRKDIRSLDAVMSTGRKHAFATQWEQPSAACQTVSPSPAKKVKWENSLIAALSSHE